MKASIGFYATAAASAVGAALVFVFGADTSGMNLAAGAAALMAVGTAVAGTRRLGGTLLAQGAAAFAAIGFTAVVMGAIIYVEFAFFFDGFAD
jgi:hypothetical protein